MKEEGGGRGQCSCFVLHAPFPPSPFKVVKEMVVSEIVSSMSRMHLLQIVHLELSDLVRSVSHNYCNL